MNHRSELVIEKSRPLHDNEFVFYDQIVIKDAYLWEVFDYITSISNIRITKINSDNIVRSKYDNPICIRIDMKEMRGDDEKI